MGIGDIQNRKHVLAAIAEYDRLGRHRFLDKYGFGPSRSYWLVHNRKRYDSKAVVGAAHRYARPDIGPMSAADFSGGNATVRRKLESLGFRVEAKAASPTAPPHATSTPSDFLLTWKETGWPYEELREMVDEFESFGPIEATWRFISHRMAQPGARVWLLKQGPGPKVIFGAGEITDEPRLDENGVGKQQMMVPVRFDLLVDPREQYLIDEPDVRHILRESQIRAQASGYPLSVEQGRALQKLLSNGRDKPISPGKADTDTFDPKNLSDARERISRTIVQRRGQQAFRDALITAYDGKCAITGCSVLDVLEAAHIHPYLGPDTNKTSNGLLLRADLHTLFDCRLLAIDPEALTVIVAPPLRDTEYGRLHGRALRRSKRMPSKKALRHHLIDCGLD